jgi:uroporphyrinogen decarboxylase
MTGAERVKNTILGLPVDRQPIYAWVRSNLSEEITEAFGSVENFEDHYEFDAAHIFGTPYVLDKAGLEALRGQVDELTPDILLEHLDLYVEPTAENCEKLKQSLDFYKSKGRFCYIQTPGFFEYFNGVFGIQNQLMYLLLYKDELAQLYARQAEWIVKFADVCIEMGADCIHISDDWGSQKDLMFDPKLWEELIKPNLKRVIDHVHAKGVFVSLHSDGCIEKVVPGLAEIGIDMVHPWQESAGMSYDAYLEKYADRFAILGGLCVQTAFGILGREELLSEVTRVFDKMRGKRWICCTSHFVQKHCSVEDLTAAYDLVYRLARG